MISIVPFAPSHPYTLTIKSYYIRFLHSGLKLLSGGNLKVPSKINLLSPYKLFDLNGGYPVTIS